jgi:hypothetical protein
MQILDNQERRVVGAVDPIVAPLAVAIEIIGLLRDRAAGAAAALADTTYRAWDNCRFPAWPTLLRVF